MRVRAILKISEKQQTGPIKFGLIELNTGRELQRRTRNPSDLINQITMTELHYWLSHLLLRLEKKMVSCIP
jgi:hypothetical protein